MKKVFFSLFAAWSLLIGSATIAQAGSNTDELKIHFRENTMVVRSTKMTAARLYDYDNGKLLQKREGKWCEFELERGTYKLYAKVDGKTVSRKIVFL